MLISITFHTSKSTTMNSHECFFFIVDGSNDATEVSYTTLGEV